MGSERESRLTPRLSAWAAGGPGSDSLRWEDGGRDGVSGGGMGRRVLAGVSVSHLCPPKSRDGVGHWLLEDRVQGEDLGLGCQFGRGRDRARL